MNRFSAGLVSVVVVGHQGAARMNSISEVIAILERLDESPQRQLLEITQTLLEDQQAEQHATTCG